MSRKGLNNSLFYFSRKGNIRKNEKNKDCDESKVQNSITLGGTSRVVLELNPFGISIRGSIGSEPWVGRSIGKMSGGSNGQGGWPH